MSFEIFTPLYTKLNLMQLPTDLTTVGYYVLDLTVVVLPLELSRFLPGLGRISIFQRLQPLSSSLCELLSFELRHAYRNANPPELILLSYPQRVLQLLPSVEYPCTHKGVIRPELSCSFDLQGNSVLFPFLPQMENLDALLAILLLKPPLVESAECSTTL
jgi:hypothetical protein